MHGPRTRRILAAATLAALLAGSAWAALASRYILRPDVDPLQQTDATYVLASSGGVEVILQDLYTKLPGRVLVVSTTPELMAMPAYAKLCAAGTSGGREVVCTTPDPLTTRGEARVFAGLARERGWTSVTVVSHRTHLSRSRMLMERCFPGTVRMHVQESEGRRAKAVAVLYETGAYVKASVLRGC
ncbi:hypothetical protein GCM10027418_25300 [Mariniluteicoccus endophyticus]